MITDVQFQPVVGETLLLQALQKQGGLPDGGRVNMNVAEVGSMLFTVGLGAEIAAALATGTAVQQTARVTLGERSAAVRKVDMNDPVVRAYAVLAEGGYEALRWFPESIDNPRASYPSWGYAPLMTPALYRQVVNAPWLAVGVIGVAAAAAAGIAYWGGKREDRIASVGVEQIRTTAAVNAALSLAAQQLAAGQPIDPRLLDVLKTAGASIEGSRSWSVPVALGVAGAGLAGAAYGGYRLSK